MPNSNCVDQTADVQVHDLFSFNAFVELYVCSNSYLTKSKIRVSAIIMLIKDSTHNTYNNELI